MIERCTDYRRIKKFRKPVISNRIYYLMETRGGVDVGLWTLDPTDGALQIHADMGPDCRGARAVESAKAVFGWAFKSPGIKKIVADIPNSERGAQFMASWAGMRYDRSIDGRRQYSITKG